MNMFPLQRKLYGLEKKHPLLSHDKRVADTLVNSLISNGSFLQEFRTSAVFTFTSMSPVGIL